jgi:hypothetical protein
MDHLDKLWDMFLTWQFGVACLAVQALIIGFKKVAYAFSRNFLSYRPIRVFLALQNMLWGVVVAIPKVLPGETFGTRVLFGLCAGLLSHSLYEVALKRIPGLGTPASPLAAPPGALDSSEDRTVPSSIPPKP